MADILVVDDDESIRYALRRYLEHDGHHIVEAENGQQGVQYLEKNSVDLVITDILMPEKDGLEMIRILRKEHPQIRIIAISAGGMVGPMDYLSMAKGLGANRILPKPFRCGQLVLLVNELLHMN